jgi:hypothetical protein
LPRAHVVDDGVGDAADQVVADVDAVELGEVRLDVTDRQAARVERDDLLVKAGEAALARGRDLRREAALAIPRRLDPDRPMLGLQRLGRRPVARVPGPARRRLAVVIAEMVGQLSVHRALHQPAREIRQQPARPDDLLLAARPGEHLVDQLIAQTLADPIGQPRDPGIRGRRAAGIPLRSPSGLAPRDAGARPRLLDPAPGWHETPFRSCLHRGSDTSESHERIALTLFVRGERPRGAVGRLHGSVSERVGKSPSLAVTA